MAVKLTPLLCHTFEFNPGVKEKIIGAVLTGNNKNPEGGQDLMTWMPAVPGKELSTDLVSKMVSETVLGISRLMYNYSHYQSKNLAIVLKSNNKCIDVVSFHSEQFSYLNFP